MDKNLKARTQRLEHLATEHGTDKLTHGYLPHYGSHLPKKVDKMLEIGCFKGASLRMWRDFYGPAASIHTIDLFQDPENASRSQMVKEGFVCHKGNQGDFSFLNRLGSHQYDLIIDDRSHNADHQQLSFLWLFHRNLSPGGLYVVEDLHCCKEPFYYNNHPLIHSLEDTILGALKKFQSTGEMNGFFKEYRASTICKMISQVEILDEKIAFIKKTK